jgi:hypothetical protein
VSRQAYESYFGQSAPANALFGVDMAYPQAYSGPSTLDYNFCKGYWLDVHSWADFACIRTSYGQGGDDGAQGLHFQIANELSYPGAMGCYHFVYAQYGVQANYNNFISRSEPFADQSTFDMMDYEVSPNAGDGFINQMCDMVEQRRQRTCFVYGGKSYLDAAGGGISCEADKLWIAHYAASGSNAMQPTTSWSSWGAPLMPNQYGAVMPGIWQWSSLTAQHGHLDLNISTLPKSAFGIGASEEEDLTPEERQWLSDIHFALTGLTSEGDPRWASQEARINVLYDAIAGSTSEGVARWKSEEARQNAIYNIASDDKASGRSDVADISRKVDALIARPSDGSGVSPEKIAEIKQALLALLAKL